jgi:hypothetical protein
MRKSRQRHLLEGKKISVYFNNKHQRNQAQLQLNSRLHVIHKYRVQHGRRMEQLTQTCIKLLHNEG